MNPQQMANEDHAEVLLDRKVGELARRAYQEARQRVDIRRDLTQRLRPSEGPLQEGESIWYWHKDLNKIRGGIWRKSRVVALDRPPMIKIDLDNTT
eukprot:10694832-Karenia_brevis.AAC.1